MDFERAADILNMDLTGSDPGPRGQHMIRYWPTEKAEEILHPEIPNMPDEIVEWDDDADYLWRSPADAWNETTDTRRDYSLTIAFDAGDDLEARLTIDALVHYARRKLQMSGLVFTAELP